MTMRRLIASPPWTSEQDARLHTLMASGESPAAIARQLSRTEAAIDNRARKLKITVAQKSQRVLRLVELGLRAKGK
jgi:DNA-binding NarL/FixJ family response regulator